MAFLPFTGSSGHLTDRHAPGGGGPARRGQGADSFAGAASEPATRPAGDARDAAPRPADDDPGIAPRPSGDILGVVPRPPGDGPGVVPRPGPVRRAAAELGTLAPGLGVAAAVVVLSTALSRAVPGTSAAVIAVACGVALTNLGGFHRSLRPGLRFAGRRLLRLAIVLLGLQIALPEVLALGWRALMVIAAATGGTFLATRWIGKRMGVSPRRSLLIATGVSVCGAAAVAAMHEVADSDDDDVASAVSVVVLYGSATIVVLPLLARFFGLTPHQFGVWAGASVHEVAQVAAIGATAGAGVLASAVVAKLARVVLLAPIVALTSATLRRGAAPRPPGAPGTGVPEGGGADTADTADMTDTGTSGTAGDKGTAGGVAEGGAGSTVAGAGRRPPVMPLFVAGFLTMVIARSTGLVPAEVTRALPEVTGVLLAAALFGLGTGVNLRELARGGRSLLLGGAATAVIGVISLLGVVIMG
ncbi:YeiH family protein [Streptosporangium roseum]|uniref:Membrane protein-like protein n=1 Tax=Streptosporangium roseum (strain ATCC 12428 / DSM 43021 / JCM 3005 / KCTC 9067 / NCIMB 10171 / NRRL 2505 / NI 9100) TaxID=479432 RepID=D2B0A8_STRRD|nr:putative sulfate exporter family transporter [Streptosporangium roseum]ACZ89114.1 membrane protein-like protein [Streptosporangium roseum DSM 43021]